MRRIPILATLVVALAIATMIALGLWQLDRLDEKESQLAVYRANMGKPAIAMPTAVPIPDTALFRRSSALCSSVTGWQTQAGRSAKGIPGYRWIATCPGLIVDVGVTRDPKTRPSWLGGSVTGVITTEPSHTSLLSRMGGKEAALRTMLVSNTPAPGLEASAPPSPDEVPNNHLAYSVQWFLFAGVAALIYGLALRRRASAS